MPTYQYSCTECGHFLEQFQAFTDDALTECPVCGGRLRKVFNAVGVVFKGSGFYRNDSRSADAKGAGAKEGGSDSGSTKESGSKDSGSGSKDSGGSTGSASKDTSTSGSKDSAKKAPTGGTKGSGGS